MQVEPGAADEDGRPPGGPHLREDGTEQLQPAGDRGLLGGGEDAVEAVRRLGQVRSPRPGGEDRQIGEQLLAVGVDDDAVQQPGQLQGQGGLAAGGTAP